MTDGRGGATSAPSWHVMSMDQYGSVWESRRARAGVTADRYGYHAMRVQESLPTGMDITPRWFEDRLSLCGMHATCVQGSLLTAVSTIAC